ncbi:kelch-like protein 21 [Paramacrobiotus metropolitanus]|uniref:kelch-like protein 21 n=1 Tax=Paramacrobiotus metropolitanus TaxID=2943436 RepID=UPI002445A82A|nr:kelch-like protein 21 [Paramacrobiotus metropolitanus]
MAGIAPCTSGSTRKRLRLSDNSTLPKLDGTEFLLGLQDARHDFCDVAVRGAVDPEKPAEAIPCHRNVLMARSGWFRRMLRSQSKESQQNTIQLHNVPHDILQQLIDYMYSCEVSVSSSSNALLLLQAADLLEMRQIADICQLFLRKNLNLANWLSLYREAQQMSSTTLKEACQAFALEHFVSIAQSQDFLELDVAELKQLIASEELNAEKEQQVADAVVRWLGHSLPQRARCAVDLVRRIRTPLLAAEYLASLSDTPAGQHVQQAVFSVADAPSRVRSSYQPVIVFLRGYDTQKKFAEHKNAAELYCLDPLTPSIWSVPCAVPPGSWGGPMLYMVKDGRLRIYVLVDAIGQEDPCRLYMYDASVDQWTNVGKFSVRDACLAAIHDRIYVMGGDRAMYAFDEEHRQLIAKAKMPTLLHGSATVAYDGRLYVVGGMYWPSRNASHRAATAAYCYDPARNVWEELAPMPTGRFGCRACVGPDGLIYVVDKAQCEHCNETAYPVADAYFRITAERPTALYKAVAENIVLKGSFDQLEIVSPVITVDLVRVKLTINNSAIPYRFTEPGIEMAVYRIPVDPAGVNLTNTTSQYMCGHYGLSAISVQPAYIYQLGYGEETEDVRVWYEISPSIYEASTISVDDSFGAVNGTRRRLALSSWVTGASLSIHSSQLRWTEPVIVRFRIINFQPSLKYFCAFWNADINNGFGAWSTKGCITRIEHNGFAACYCDHLTSFGILVDVSGLLNVAESTHKILTLFSHFALGLSITALAIVIIVTTIIRMFKRERRLPFKNESTDKDFVLVNLSLALILTYLTFLCGIDRMEMRQLCLVTGVFLHWFFLVSFAWLAAEGYLLARAFVANRPPVPVKHFQLFSGIMCWIVPFTIVGINLIIDRFGYGYGLVKSCWLDSVYSPQRFYLTVVVPICAVLAGNFIVFALVAMRIAWTKSPVVSGKPDGAFLTTSLRRCAVLCALLGLPWLLLLINISDHNSSTSITMNALIAAFCGTQGLGIFLTQMCGMKATLQRIYRSL